METVVGSGLGRMVGSLIIYPSPSLRAQNMDAELFLGKEQEEVEESTTPYQVSRLLQEAFYKADKVRTHTNGMPTTCSARLSSKGHSEPPIAPAPLESSLS